MHQVRSLLSPREWFYSLSLLLPLGLYNLAVKWAHISQFGALGWLPALNLLRSNLFFSLGFAVFWIGMLALSGGVWTRRVIVVLMHVSSLAYAVIITGAHQFFAITGSSLDYSLIALAFTSFNELKPVIASEVSFSSFAVVCWRRTSWMGRSHAGRSCALILIS